MKLIKMVFSLAFVALSFVWVLFAAEMLFPEEVNIFAKWDWFQDTLLPLIKQSYIDHPQGFEGFQLVVYSGSILLIYSSLIFFISKIPVVGDLIKTITGFIAFFSIILIIIGVLLWIGVFPL